MTPGTRPPHPRTRRRFVGFVAVLALFGATLLAVEVRASTSAGALVATDVQRAAQYAAGQATQGAAVVYDTKTNQAWGGGGYGRTTFASESLIKTFIAARLLVSGQMSGTTAAVAWKMITQSDDASANALYGQVGGDSLIDWVKSYYNIPFLGNRPSQPGWWGNTHVTALGMAYFLARAKADPKVGPWLLNAMHNATTYGSDGFYQAFGIPQATTGAAIKQGWGNDTDAFSATELNSTGYVNGDRFVVVLFTAHSPETSFSTVMATISTMARLVMPGGRVDITENHNPIGHVDTLWANGSTVRMTGWTVDPDIPNKSITATLTRNGVVQRVFWADQLRTDVNNAIGVSGNHGFSTAIVEPDGPATYCVQFNNIYTGTGNPRTCAALTVNGAPVGYLDSVVPTSTGAVLTGWTADLDALTSTVSVSVVDNGAGVGTFPAALARADVYARTHIPGNHGYSIPVRITTPGRHVLCAYAANLGPPSATKFLGCGAVTIASGAAAQRRVPATPTTPATPSTPASTSPAPSAATPSTSTPSVPAPSSTPADTSPSTTPSGPSPAAGSTRVDDAPQTGGPPR